MIRLHKHLAHCGVASRRKAEDLIAEGRVTVNGETVTEFGVKIDPKADEIRVDGKRIRAEKPVYYLLHKPRGVTTTASDELGRKTVLDLLEGVPERVYPVGRLDRESEGLLVLTNDGELSYYLTHPGCGVRKTYVATVEGQLPEATLHTLLREGVRLGPVLVKPLAGKILKTGRTYTRLEISVGEGINREIRRVFAALGHEVKRLVRTRLGPLYLKGLSRGKYRPLSPGELKILRKGMEKVDRAEAEAGYPPQSAQSRRPRGKRGRASAAVVQSVLGGKPDPAKSRKRPPAAGGKKTPPAKSKKTAPPKKAPASPAHPLRKKGRG